MSIDTWIIAGLVVGFIASKLIIRTGDGLLRDLGLGVAGAVVAGGIFRMMSTAEATGLNIFALVVTLAGASAVLVTYHMFYPHVGRG
jgi:uncharacterized membrane protein YeaQ/YmgE (transglycosylase-associated protein family)